MSDRFYEPGFSEPNVGRDDAYEAGVDAFHSGDACPYTDSRLATDWADGRETERMNSPASETCDCDHCHDEPEGASFPCPHCDGRGVMRKRQDGNFVAVLCDRCDGEGSRWANAGMIEDAHAIGSDNPFCPHDWSSGYDDSSGYEREVAIYCGMCGACGDA